jgi:DNA-binding transcriptional LysR family regulator
MIMYHEVSHDVAVFVEVINSGSFIGASKKLGISKPSVSRRINQLEQHLQTKLIKRTTRQLSLTEAGEVLYKQCKVFDSSFNHAIQEMADLRERPSGELKIGFSSYLANEYKASQVIAEFMEIHPAMSIQLHSFTTSADIDLINKNYHLFFTDNDMTNSSLTSSLLYKYPIRICAAPTYIQKHGMPKQPSDLKNHNCLLHFLYEKLINQWYFKQKGRYQKTIVKGNLCASRTHFLVKMVRAGAGIAMLPEFIIEKYLQSGELITVLDDFKCKDAEVFITTYRQKNIPKKIAHFIKFINAQYKNI